MDLDARDRLRDFNQHFRERIDLNHERYSTAHGDLRLPYKFVCEELDALHERFVQILGRDMR